MEQALILGIIQGLTEFLPISSSAHLFLWQKLWGEDWGITYDAFLHLGTLLAVLIYFWRDWWGLLLGIIKMDKAKLRFAAVLFVGIIPAGVVGVIAGDFLEENFRQLPVVIITLSGWAIVMAAADRYIDTVKNKVGDIYSLTWKQSLLIGLAQVLALIPGTSRSGITITAALGQKIDRPAAAKFSFLLGAPLIAGAGFLSLLKLIKEPAVLVSTGEMWVGFGASFLSGLAAIWFLLKLLTKKSLKPFVWYRIFIAAILLFFYLYG